MSFPLSIQQIEALAGLTNGLRLQPLQAEGGNSPSSVVYAQSQRPNPHKRKRTALDNALPPPMSKMGTAGASSFNDETFDISGDKQLAAGLVKREASNVMGGPGGGLPNGGGGGGGGAGSGAPLNMWGQHIPMPTVGRDHSLAPLPIGKDTSIGKGDSWGSVLRNVGLSPDALNREHSLGLGLSGLNRDMSLGSLGELPTISRGASQESIGGMMDDAAGGGDEESEK